MPGESCTYPLSSDFLLRLLTYFVYDLFAFKRDKAEGSPLALLFVVWQVQLCDLWNEKGHELLVEQHCTHLGLICELCLANSKIIQTGFGITVISHADHATTGPVFFPFSNRTCAFK